MIQRLVFSALTFFAGISVFAAGPVSIQGTSAKTLISALRKVGAAADCGAGTCGIQASDVQCVLKGNSIGTHRYECALNVMTKSGSEEKVAAIAQPARKLMKSLKTAGAEMDCGAGTCGLEIKKVECLLRGHSTGRRSYECLLSL